MTLPTYLVAWGWSGLVGGVGRAGGGPSLGLWGCLCRRSSCRVHVGTDHAGICNRKDELLRSGRTEGGDSALPWGFPFVVTFRTKYMLHL